MAQRLTDKAVKALEAPASGNRITYDDEVRGWGLRVTSQGTKAWVVNYRVGRRERRITIGAYPDWSVSAAKERAKEIKRAVDRGEDPMAERHRERAAPTMAELGKRYLAEHASRKRVRSAANDISMLNAIVLPRLGQVKVEDVRRADLAALHREVSAKTPIQANRALALLSKMLSLAVAWEMRGDNPAIGIERNPENKRERFLTPPELARLNEALSTHGHRASADAIRLLLLTGARRGEILGATWSQFDLEAGVWTKPAATTKQKKTHRVPLNAAALALLRELKARSTSSALFPGRGGNAFQGELKRSWASVCKAAQLEGLRLHDLRHSFASFLASSGLSLPTIGALLGHTQPATTHRYAHLLDSALREATERVGALVSGSRKVTGDATHTETEA